METDQFPYRPGVDNYVVFFPCFLRCLVGASSNLNEAFHSLLWQRAPKARHTGKLRLELALDISVNLWNSGYRGGLCGLMNSVGLKFSKKMADQMAKDDGERIRKARKIKTHEFLKKRKDRKAARNALAAKFRKENPDYAAGKH
jgi:hypothetical protein